MRNYDKDFHLTNEISVGKRKSLMLPHEYQTFSEHALLLPASVAQYHTGAFHPSKVLVHLNNMRIECHLWHQLEKRPLSIN